ncbi:MAG: dTDP-4-dehydrorhamnose 3,5-epimerase family protein [Armatimonadetes bacterium]|nr:dTDP-4-dehydrorhamnose 3,5-epimerase family protein [Armatimonadota bacterium]MDW8154383.1 dTDP-4-dehydrorhamnose 3,5-epimerase family protein [Armatimonadota bacterium]
MPFEFTRLEIPEVALARAGPFADARGFFMEAYKRSEFEAHGIVAPFVQDNFSRSVRCGKTRANPSPEPAGVKTSSVGVDSSFGPAR